MLIIVDCSLSCLPRFWAGGLLKISANRQIPPHVHPRHGPRRRLGALLEEKRFIASIVSKVDNRKLD